MASARPRVILIEESAVTSTKTVTIVAFGDSITEASHQPPENRWPEVLRLLLRERSPGTDITVINAGVGGNTSREGMARIEQDVLRHNPHFVLAEFGNDATPEMSPEARTWLLCHLETRFVGGHPWITNLRELMAQQSAAGDVPKAAPEDYRYAVEVDCGEILSRPWI